MINKTGAQHNNQAPETNQFPNVVYYQIFVHSFADSNNDGIGDLNGIAQKLDYIKDLGIRGIWLTPILASYSYHKYDVIDYYRIDSQYGTLADLNNLIEQAHNRGIAVIMDMVINHCSDKHPYFLSARDSLTSPYRDFFVWSAVENIETEINHWYIPKLRGVKPFKPHKFDDGTAAYYAFFWDGMPDFNYDNQQVRQAMIDVGKYWLTHTALDGFRLDAAMWIYPKTDTNKTLQWWHEYSNALRTVKPDVFLLAEVTEAHMYAAPYLANGIDAVFNFDLAQHIIDVLINERNMHLPFKVKQMIDVYEKANPNFIEATFLSNHDQNRIASTLNGDAKKIKLAASILLTLPGSPFIYYGEELGMLGKKPDEYLREPMLWSHEKDSNQCKWLKHKYNKPLQVAPVSIQQQTINSTLQHYKALINLRNHNAALAFGNIIPVQTQNQSILIYIRSFENNPLLIMHNLSSKNITIEKSSLPQHFNNVIFSSNFSSKSNHNTFTLAPYASMIAWP
ncbi:MAG: alpha-glucosidase C-terminal domain-containing protein [Bacteroidia bacterium]|nr:alpha-glucosidase C-terminal domain-containing protein [Bacteroidia bacterium]